MGRQQKKSGYGGAVKLGVAVALAAVAWDKGLLPDMAALESMAGSISGGGVAAAATMPSGPVADIPGEYVALYKASADTCPHLDWALLAGIGSVETSHGKSELPGVHSSANYAGAAGPMQFLPSTFDGVRERHPDVGPDQYDPATAVKAAAHYLCDSGLAGGDEYGAIFAYNHADWYVAKVRAKAAEYRAAT